MGFLALRSSWPLLLTTPGVLLLLKGREGYWAMPFHHFYDRDGLHSYRCGYGKYQTGSLQLESYLQYILSREAYSNKSDITQKSQ